MQWSTACSTSRNTETRNTGTSRIIPEHPKNLEHAQKPAPKKTRNLKKQMARQYVTARVSFSKLSPLIAHKID